MPHWIQGETKIELIEISGTFSSGIIFDTGLTESQKVFCVFLLFYIIAQSSLLLHLSKSSLQQECLNFCNLLSAHLSILIFMQFQSLCMSGKYSPSHFHLIPPLLKNLNFSEGRNKGKKIWTTVV